MNRNKIISFVVIFSIFRLPIANAQSNDDGRVFNRQNAMLSVAINEAQLNRSKLELVPEQVEKLNELRERQQLLIVEFKGRSAEEKKEANSFKVLSGKISELEKELTNEILLPHQVTVLRTEVFARSVQQFSGNITSAIMANHRDEFELSDAQTAQLKELEKNATEQINQAREKFRSQMEEIARDDQTKLDEIFTDKQRKILDEMNRGASTLKGNTSDK